MNAELTSSSSLSPQQVSSQRAVALRDEEWQLRQECIDLARQALHHYKSKGEKRLNIPDIGRLLDLASKLGRLSTGMPTEHIEFSSYHDPLWLAEIEKQLDAVYGKPINVPSLPVTNETPTP